MRARALVLLATLLLAVVGCGGGGTPAGPPEPAVSGAPLEVDVAQVRLQDLPQFIDTVGNTRSVNEAAIGPRSPGVVVSVPVSMGDRVHKGELLFQLDGEELLLQIEQDKAMLLSDLAALGVDRLDAPQKPDEEAPAVRRARANLDNARLTWERNQNLYRANLIAEAELQTSKQALLTAQADYQSALDQVRSSRANVGIRQATIRMDEQRLRNMAARAPFEGYITALNLNEGDYVTPGGGVGQQPYLRLTQLDPINVRLELAQVYATRLKVGQTVEVATDAFPGRTFRGRVVHVNPASDPQTRTIAVDTRFANPEGLLKPGLFGAVQLKVGTRVGAPLVPQAALQKTIGAFQVFVVDAGPEGSVARAVDVSSGEMVGDWMAVEGLKGAQQVVVTSLDRLYDGAPVRVRAVVQDPGAPGR